VGVSENIIEASWQALADSMNYALLRCPSGTEAGGERSDVGEKIKQEKAKK
jgi:hypothetical protein